MTDVVKLGDLSEITQLVMAELGQKSTFLLEFITIKKRIYYHMVSLVKNMFLTACFLNER